MSKARITRWFPRGNKLTVLLYVVIFASLLSHAIQGVGQYWDWVFPYYPDQVGNFFGRASESWTRDANGSPLGYSTDYLLRFVISIFHFVPPEWLLYEILIMIFTAGAYVVYLLGRRHTKPWLAFLLGLVAFINPVIFYNFTAGYVDYLVSYMAFIYLAYFLLYRYRPTLRSAVIVGLLVTVIGVQIQLFAVAAILIALFFVFRPEDFRWKHMPAMVGVPVLISMIWLSNFLFGGADLSEVSGSAAKATFKGLADSNYLNIFSFSFAKATLISRFYGFYELLLYGLFFTFIVLLIIRAKRKTADDVFLLSFMLLMLFLATGLFQLINLGPITMLYPMFREVGHFAPLILLAMVILMARLMTKTGFKWLVALWLVAVIAVSFGKFQAYTQSINFASVRQQFAEFKVFGDQHKDADHRVLSYPFFDQYALVKSPMRFQDNLPLKNSGHDSYTAFAGEQFVKNAVKPADFKTSVQYQLLQTMDVDVLQPYNVRYIYDFSGVYESYYDRYVAPATYDNDISLIKNNPYFLQQLMAANPGKLKQVSPHILEVLDATPRVSDSDTLYSVDSGRAGEDARQFMEQSQPKQVYNYAVLDKDKSSSVPHGSVAPLFADAATPNLLNQGQKSLQQSITLPGGNKATLYSNSVPRNLTYKITGSTLAFYAVSSGKLYANGQLMQDYDAGNAQTLGSLTMARGYHYYAALNGSIVPLDGSSNRIGTVTSASKLEVFVTDDNNLVKNPSFENGASWTPTVDDCNAYDNKPDIAMRIDGSTATDGSKSLELSARRHDACTSTEFSLKSGGAYLLSYDYKGQNTQSASFYLRFNNSDQSAIKSFQNIADTDWHHINQLITAPDNTQNGELTVHASASDTSTPAITHYDNVRMLSLQQIGSLDIPEPKAKYETTDLHNTGTVSFSFQDNSYDYKNVVQNASFEQGPWQDKVTDCNNYDKAGKIAANISKDARDGAQSLQLEATKHTACEYANVAVQPDTDYILTFDYKGTKAQQAGYYLEYTGAGTGSQEQIDVADNSWHTYTTRVHTPETITSARLYLHAYEGNGTTKNTVNFDNVRLVAVPSTSEEFYVVSEPAQPMRQPKSMSFKTIDSTHRTVKVTGASGPFVIGLSESYHPEWRLELQDNKLGGLNAWRPGAAVNAVGEHFEMNNYENAWYIDPSTICGQNQAGCHRNADGSYDIDLMAEFVPQRWFVVNRFISVATLIVATGYVALTHARAKQSYESEGVYQHPLATRRKKK